MKFFGRGQDVATEVAIGPASDSDNAAEKHIPPAVNADALERVPSQNVQVGLSPMLIPEGRRTPEPSFATEYLTMLICQLGRREEDRGCHLDLDKKPIDPGLWLVRAIPNCSHHFHAD